MKKLLLIIFIATFALNSTAQIVFEKGYFIDNAGQKTECLIKNLDWKNNPTAFEYEAAENSEVKTTNIKQVQEFGVYNFSKYVRATVNIDVSTDNLQKLTYDRQPKFQEKEIFLNVLIEGKANLYEFVDDNATRYLYNLNDTAIEQLVYKRYVDDASGNDFKKNSRYKQQLFNNVKCPDFTMQKVDRLEYNRQDLVKYFIQFNECNNETAINYKEGQKRDFFNLTIRPGVNNSSLTVDHTNQKYRGADFKNKWNFRIGLEAEFILPFNKDTWAILVEPTYQSYKDESTTRVTNGSIGELTAIVDYKSIELPVSIRYYFFSNEKSKIFLNVGYAIDFSSNSTFIYQLNSGLNFDELDINKTRNNLVIGAGYKFDKKYSIELRYLSPREIFGKYIFYDSKYKTVSIILGYSIF